MGSSTSNYSIKFINMKRVKIKISDMIIDKLTNVVYNKFVNQINTHAWNQVSNKMWFRSTDRISNTVNENIKL